MKGRSWLKRTSSLAACLQPRKLLGRATLWNNVRLFHSSRGDDNESRGQSLTNQTLGEKRQNTLFHPKVESFPAFSPAAHKSLRGQKVPTPLPVSKALVRRPFLMPVSQSAGIRQSRATAKDCCNRVPQIFFPIFSFLIRFSFSFEPTPIFFPQPFD
ncbi:hypothetical protein V8C37DRAFT_248811 [Trichoderma ceciliae]